MEKREFEHWKKYALDNFSLINNFGQSVIALCINNCEETVAYAVLFMPYRTENSLRQSPDDRTGRKLERREHLGNRSFFRMPWH